MPHPPAHVHQVSVATALCNWGLLRGSIFSTCLCPAPHQLLLRMLFPSQHPGSVTPAASGPQLPEYSHCHLVAPETTRGKRRTLSSAASTQLRTVLGCLTFTSSIVDIANNHSYLCGGGFVLFSLHTGFTLGSKSHGQDIGRVKGTSPPQGHAETEDNGLGVRQGMEGIDQDINCSVCHREICRVIFPKDCFETQRTQARNLGRSCVNFCECSLNHLCLWALLSSL